MEIVNGIKSKCCNADVGKTYNKREPGQEEEFYCTECDKECDFYEKEEKEEINKVEMCAKYLIVQLIDTGAEELTITEKGFSFEGKKLGDFEVIVRKI